ncbi:DUF2807 domain-containing protein [Hymenobacter sediminis]|uniref:head GIN domain-containing protein n=1 Tax=Hymenobacter sediminis TaxID=2218621 RepID=UPI000DA6BD19|nr:head GIN domain-containing protein [Hymenobacter sediminis]RPD47846.1 DUF2807 domain-containing protein [Hymenobacter sediminis]
MKTKQLLLPLLAVLWLPSCDNGITGPRVRGTGPSETETRTLSSFNRIELKVDGEVIITQGPQQEVRVEAQRNILDVLETEISGNELEIEYGNVNVRDHDPVKVYVTVPALTEVHVSGSGKIRSAAPWSAEKFEVKVSGSGEADISFTQITSLRTDVSGSGEVRLAGASQSHNISISGSGRVAAYDLNTQDSYVSISGSGRSYVLATRTLNADISGSGSVYYRGTPAVNSRISGSGKVIVGG